MRCYEYLDLEQGSDPWLEMRRLIVTATDYPVISGEMTWTRSGPKTPLGLYHQKVMGTKIPDNVYMERGRRLEAQALVVIEEKLGIKLNKPKDRPIVRNLDHPWMMASLDGWNEETEALVEIKCPMGENLLKAQYGEIPIYWKMQGDYQMTVLGITSMYFFIYSDDGEQYVIPHSLTEEAKEQCIELSKEFYDCLVNGEEPDVTEDDYIEIDDKEAIELAKALEKQIESHKISEKVLKGLKEKVLAKTDDGNCTFKDCRLKISRCAGRETIDWKAIAEELEIPEEIINKHTKQGIGYPRFILVGGKND